MLARTLDCHKSPCAWDGLACISVFCILLTFSTTVWSALALGVAAGPLLASSSTKEPSSSSSPTTGSNLARQASKPAWQDLTPAQQISLRPLAANWSTLGEPQKRKWIAIAANYPALAPAEQAKLHSRMTEWVSLSQQQRAQARLNFAESKQLTPTQKAANWQAYQALSPEEKQKLAISAAPRPTGAAAAAKPVPPQKMAVVPMTRHTPKQATQMLAAHHPVNRDTLLPPTQSPVASAPTQKN